MSKDMQAGSRTEMKCLNTPRDDDSCSSNSNDFAYSDFPKKFPLNGFTMSVAGPEDNSSSSICSNDSYLVHILDGGNSIPGISCQHQDSLCSASVSSDEQSDAEIDMKCWDTAEDDDAAAALTAAWAFLMIFRRRTFQMAKTFFTIKTQAKRKKVNRTILLVGEITSPKTKTLMTLHTLTFPRRFFFRSVIFLIFGEA